MTGIALNAAYRGMTQNNPSPRSIIFESIMKLDRNTNPDGKGKYALINLRTNKVEWGNNLEDEFFVIKLKDRFAERALRAYALAVREFIKHCDPPLTEHMEEWAEEVEGLADKARDHKGSRCSD